MKPLVVLATDSEEPSGLGEHMLTLAQELQPRFDVVVACQDGQEGKAVLRRAAGEGLRIKALDCTRRDLVTDWLIRCKASLLHVHAGIGWEGHDLVRSGKAAGLPVVRTEHLPYLLTDLIQKAEYRAMLLCVDQRIAVSEAVLQSYAEQGRGMLTLVRNGIRRKPGRPLSCEARRAIGLAEDDKLLLTVARLTPQKAHAILLSAIPEILDREPRAKFVLVGRGPEQAAIERQAREMGVDHAVRLLGYRTDVPDLLASADLFVLPSHFEGLSLALLEAMAFGLPVVATRIGGTVEALGQDHPFLVAAGNAAALATAALEALGDPAGAQRASDAAKARFLERFSSERMTRETSAVYERLLVARNLEGKRE